MFDIGFMELLVVGVLGLLVLGPERLPKAARTLGLMIGKVRRSMSNIQEDLERHARTEELKAKLRDPAATFLDKDILDPLSMRKASDNKEADDNSDLKVSNENKTPASDDTTK